MERYPIQFMIRISEELKEKIVADAEADERSTSFIARKILEKHYGIGKKIKKKRK
jgi:predicted DNA-binding protein